MSLGQWLTIYFKKVLTQLLWEMEKAVRTFFFLIKTFFKWIVNHWLKGIR